MEYNEMSAEALSLELAKSLHDNGNYVGSQEACEQLYVLQPNNLNVVLLLSANYYMQKNYDKSIEILRKVPENDRERLEVLRNLGASYFSNHQYPEACNAFYLAVTKERDSVECWLHYILALIKMEEFDDAIESLNMLINYNPNEPKAFILYGQLMIKLKKFEKAKSLFQKAIVLEPEADESWIGMGDSFGFSEQFPSAILCYKKALEINNSLIIPRINLGSMYYQLKQFDASIFFWQTAIQMNPQKYFSVLPMLARAYFYNENVQMAITIYTFCLEHNPHNVVALHGLGMIHYNHFGNAADAEQFFKLCVDLDERNVLYNKSLAAIYRELGKKDLAFQTVIKCAKIYIFKNDYINAAGALNDAINLCPTNFYPYWKLGQTFYKMEFYDKALSRYEDARRLRPYFFLIYSDIACVYEKQNRLDDAEEYYRKALQLKPNHCDTVKNLIALKHRRGHIEDVIELYNLLLKDSKLSNTDRFEIHKNYANFLYNEFGNVEDAYNHFVKASEICNTDFDTYFNLGKLSQELRNTNNALRYFWKVCELDSKFIKVHTHIGGIYIELKQFNEAINEFKKVLNHQPHNRHAYCQLIECQQNICGFRNLDEMHLNKFKTIVFQQLAINKMPSVSLQHSLLGNFESEVLVQIASSFAKQFMDKPYIQRSLSGGYVHDISVSIRCIRVGYIYTDCISHPTSNLVKSIRKLHDRNKFDIFYYSLSPIVKFRSNNLSAPDCCIDISNLSSIDAAKKINADGIHILIDVGNSTKNLEYEIFALKPAPIQVKLLGHPGTSGANFIDYLITDEECSPPELDCLYTERLAYLKRTVFFGDHMLFFKDLSQRTTQKRTANMNNSNTTSMYSSQIFPDDSTKNYTRQMYNLPEDSIVYCYFGQLYKINQNTLNMWITILKGVNSSVLWLLRFIKGAENNIHEYVAMNGINPARIIFSDVVPKDEHLRRIQLADIFLDTPQYNGHTSCLDALWAGTPIITLSGDTFASRMATSQLTALNCLETIAKTEDDYIRIAINLGTHTHLLDQIRQHIWKSRTSSTLFDSKSYCDQLENLYLDMWKKLF